MVCDYLQCLNGSAWKRYLTVSEQQLTTTVQISCKPNILEYHDKYVKKYKI